MSEEAKPRITEDTGCTVDAGSLVEIMFPGYRVYFHGIPKILDEGVAEHSMSVSLQITSVSVIDPDGDERYVDLPHGGLYVYAPYSQLKPFMED